MPQRHSPYLLLRLRIYMVTSHCEPTPIILRYKISSSTENRQRSGRPKKMNERDLRHLANDVKKNRRATLQNITNDTPSDVSQCTIRKSLHELGLSNRVAAKKPFISAKNQAKRLAFARKYQKMTVDDWKHVLWTDESSFETGKNSRQVRVWRSSSERFNSSCLTP